ncbi:unnamed protein product [Amoebophrya sp. A25]|nr:unnamed protein product [Amoebophrya sp. A25]|eukprot:GSA25T00005597001.1
MKIPSLRPEAEHLADGNVVFRSSEAATQALAAISKRADGTSVPPKVQGKGNKRFVSESPDPFRIERERRLQRAVAPPAPPADMGQWQKTFGEFLQAGLQQGRFPTARQTSQNHLRVRFLAPEKGQLYVVHPPAGHENGIIMRTDAELASRQVCILPARCLIRILEVRGNRAKVQRVEPYQESHAVNAEEQKPHDRQFHGEEVRLESDEYFREQEKKRQQHWKRVKASVRLGRSADAKRDPSSDRGTPRSNSGIGSPSSNAGLSGVSSAVSRGGNAAMQLSGGARLSVIKEESERGGGPQASPIAAQSQVSGISAVCVSSHKNLKRNAPSDDDTKKQARAIADEQRVEHADDGAEEKEAAPVDSDDDAGVNKSTKVKRARAASSGSSSSDSDSLMREFAQDIADEFSDLEEVAADADDDKAGADEAAADDSDERNKESDTRKKPEDKKANQDETAGHVEETRLGEKRISEERKIAGYGKVHQEDKLDNLDEAEDPRTKARAKEVAESSRKAKYRGFHADQIEDDAKALDGSERKKRRTTEEPISLQKDTSISLTTSVTARREAHIQDCRSLWTVSSAVFRHRHFDPETKPFFRIHTNLCSSLQSAAIQDSTGWVSWKAIKDGTVMVQRKTLPEWLTNSEWMISPVDIKVAIDARGRVILNGLPLKNTGCISAVGSRTFHSDFHGEYNAERDQIVWLKTAAAPVMQWVRKSEAFQAEASLPLAHAAADHEKRCLAAVAELPEEELFGRSTAPPVVTANHTTRTFNKLTVPGNPSGAGGAAAGGTIGGLTNTSVQMSTATRSSSATPEEIERWNRKLVEGLWERETVLKGGVRHTERIAVHDDGSFTCRAMSGKFSVSSDYGISSSGQGRGGALFRCIALLSSDKMTLSFWNSSVWSRLRKPPTAPSVN